MQVTQTMTALEQWQWFLRLRRGEERRGFEPGDAITHGTTTGYTFWMCRCEPCRGAAQAYKRDYRRRRRERERTPA